MSYLPLYFDDQILGITHNYYFPSMAEEEIKNIFRVNLRRRGENKLLQLNTSILRNVIITDPNSPFILNAWCLMLNHYFNNYYFVKNEKSTSVLGVTLNDQLFDEWLMFIESAIEVITAKEDIFDWMCEQIKATSCTENNQEFVKEISLLVLISQVFNHLKDIPESQNFLEQITGRLKPLLAFKDYIQNSVENTIEKIQMLKEQYNFASKLHVRQERK